MNRQNLALMTELGDKSAQGRACGNLGNTHYLLGNFNQAIVYHQEVCVSFHLVVTQPFFFQAHNPTFFLLS